MCVYYDITTPDKAYEFLTNLGFTDQQLVNEFVLECEKDSNEFAERNIAILDTVNQIHKFTFGDLPKDYAPYSESEITYIKKWMLRNAIDRAFSNCFDEQYIYIRDNDYIPPEQIIRCEIME